jgi:hypothetical protein
MAGVYYAPVLVAAAFKAVGLYRSDTGIVSLSPTWDMDVCMYAFFVGGGLKVLQRVKEERKCPTNIKKEGMLTVLVTSCVGTPF